MYGHIQKVYGENPLDAKTLPQNDTNYGEWVDLGGANGAFELVLKANTALSVADTKALTVVLQHSDDNGSTSADFATIYSLTAAAGSGAIDAGTELARFALPSTVKKSVRAKVTTTDAAATGKLDLVVQYLPR